MDRYYSNPRKSAKRKPLGDGTSKANTQRPSSPVKSQQSPLKLEKAVPRNESLIGNGTFAVRHTVGSAENKHLSKVSDDDQQDSKRNSAISTTSTNASGTARKRKTHIGPWQLGSTIGKGGTARVRKVRHAVTGQTGVAKIVARPVAEKARALSLMNLVKSVETGQMMMQVEKAIPLGLEREIAIMKLLDHPNIVRLFDVWENRNEIYLIMEYVQGGELFDYVARRRRLEEDITVYLFRQIVAALLYCDRLNIHHRDLKPENILLDYENMTVKLVDFGMAALQPAGNFLTTPCGSPHYAAPELLSSTAYDGGQADVWSCGVVLFVMLTGYPPFNFPPDPQNIIPEDRKLKALFRAIHRADYRMPGALSVDAQDLIRKIFIPDPQKRITIKQIWHHPFIHKYDAMFGFQPAERIESLIGPKPTIDGWVALTPKRIDHDIFRALRTLWHSEEEDVLIQRLCNDEPTQEKYFYNAMLKYREENLENLQYSPSGIGYSASDYQHSKPAVAYETELENSSSQPKSLPRSKSGFSIAGSEHLQSRHSFYEIPLSEASYDPFRASREPITRAKASYVNVTVHPVNPSGSRNLKTSIHSNRGSSLRVEVLRKDSRRSTRQVSRSSGTSVSLKGSPAHRSHTPRRRYSRSSSRLSMTSSQWLSSSPIAVMRPSDMRKRSVQFYHSRKSSTASGLTSHADSEGLANSPDQRGKALLRLGYHPSRSSMPYTSSPRIQSRHVVRSRKENLHAIQPTPRTRKMRDIEQEARKVSTELEKACEEAFFRSSISSSVRTSLTDKNLPLVDTPPSSISNRSPYNPQNNTHFDLDAVKNRPLPPTPVTDAKVNLQTTETPSTYTARELAEIRERLAVRYAQDGAGNQKYFNDVLKQLDKLMMPAGWSKTQPEEGKRAVSAPQQQMNVLEELNFLHVIPEEGRFADAEEFTSKTEKGGRSHRVVTEPQGRRGPVNKPIDQTIRLVQPSSPLSISPTTPAPLKIRKPSGNSTASYKRKTRALGNSKKGTMQSGSFDVGVDVDAITTIPEIRDYQCYSAHFDLVDDEAPVMNNFRVLNNTPVTPVLNGSPCLTISDSESMLPGPFQGLDERQEKRDLRAASLSPKEPNTSKTAQGMQKKSLFRTLFKKSSKITEDSTKNMEPSTENYKRMDLKTQGQVAVQPVTDLLSKQYSANLLHGHYNFFAQLLGYVPAAMVIPLLMCRDQAWVVICKMVSNHPCVENTPEQPAQSHTRSFKVIASRSRGFFAMNCTFDLEIFEIQRYDKVSGYSVMRITQTHGSAKTLRKMARELKAELLRGKYVVLDAGLAGEICDLLKTGLVKPKVNKPTKFGKALASAQVPADQYGEVTEWKGTKNVLA